MNEKRLQEIQARKLELKAIEQRTDATEEELNNAIQEAKNLNEEERKIKEAEVELKKVNEGKDVKEVVNPQKDEERKMDDENKKEYRSALLKRLQGKELTETEERALTNASNSVGAAIPTETQNEIVKKISQYAPLLGEITLLNVAGNVTFAVEGTKAEAAIHTQGASITPDGDVLVPVSLTGFEITKYITISKTVSKMSVDAFEEWLTNMIAEAIAKKISNLIINGTGSSQPTGIEKAATWNQDNSITVAKAASLTAANVLGLVALLPGGYDNGAKWLMSKKTLYTDFMPLQDNSKNSLVKKENGVYYIEGYPVLLDDSVTLHEAFLGNIKKYVGNLSEDITVDSDKQLSSNSIEFLGCAIFDGKPAIAEAFVKLIKAAV